MNLIRWVISFLFFSNSPFLIAQSGFKKVVNFEGYLNLNFANIEFHDDKLYVVGDGYNMDKNLRGVFIAVFDTLGSLIRHTTYLVQQT